MTDYSGFPVSAMQLTPGFGFHGRHRSHVYGSIRRSRQTPPSKRRIHPSSGSSPEARKMYNYLCGSSTRCKVSLCGWGSVENLWIS